MLFIERFSNLKKWIFTLYVMFEFIFSLIAKFAVILLVGAMLLIVISVFYVMAKDRGNSGSTNDQGGLPWL